MLALIGKHSKCSMLWLAAIQLFVCPGLFEGESCRRLYRACHFLSYLHRVVIISAAATKDEIIDLLPRFLCRSTATTEEGRQTSIENTACCDVWRLIAAQEHVGFNEKRLFRRLMFFYTIRSILRSKTITACATYKMASWTRYASTLPDIMIGGCSNLLRQIGFISCMARLICRL